MSNPDPKTKLAQDALAYHAQNPHGKLTMQPSKPCNSQYDLSLAYTPGVAVPCMEIHNHPEAVWEYTGRGNCVAVVSDGTAVLCETYDDPRELASEYIPVGAGSYTLVIVANGDPADTKVEPLPEETTVPDLVEWLKVHAADFPYMLTASEQVEVASGDIERLHLVLADGTSGIHLSTVRLALSVPGLDLPAYTATRAGSEGKLLRCVAEVYQAGTSNRVHRRVQDCTLQSDGTFLAELSLMPGDYDLRLWADWNGGYYNADDLNKVLVLTDNYVANGETDKKDAYYGSLSLTVNSPSLTLPNREGTQTGQSSPLGEFEGGCS